MYQTMPAGPNDLISTTLVDGRPSAPTVASVIALGSGTPDESALSNQRWNCWIGSSPAVPSSSSPLS